MLLYLSDSNQPTASSELKKLTGSQKLQIANENEKLDTMLNQVDESQNSRQTIGNTHNDLQPFACIMTERLDNINKNINLTIISEKE